jgi:uncharacterized protein (DUF2147 family)
MLIFRRIAQRALAYALLTMPCFPANQLSAPTNAQQLSPALRAAIGKWQVIDEHGMDGGQVQTYLIDGQLFGKVTKSRPGRPPNEPCTKCAGELRNKPVVGMVIIRDFQPHGDFWSGGTVLDPKTGKIYRGKIWAVGTDTLRMRGFVGISLLGRTETWRRIH